MSEDDKLRKLRIALEKGRQDFDEVVAKLRAGELQFHDSPGACAITHIGVSGAYKTLYVMAMAGELDAVAALGSRLEEFGKEQGCSSLEVDGRPGFKELYERNGLARGYRMVSVKYRKEL